MRSSPFINQDIFASDGFACSSSSRLKEVPFTLTQGEANRVSSTLSSIGRIQPMRRETVSTSNDPIYVLG